MKNNIFYFLVCIAAFFTACSKDDSNEESNSLEVNSAVSLTEALEIEGATKNDGEIPYPGNGEYGGALEIQTSSIIVTPNSSFNFTSRVKGDGGLMFFKIEGADEYFEIPYEAENRISENAVKARRKSKPENFTKQEEENWSQWCRPNPPIRLKANALITEPATYNATVQTFDMPAQAGGPVDFNHLDNWSPPQEVEIRVIPTGEGNITITLTWDKDDSDIDLWLEEPDGNKIYYANPESTSGGFLDYDNVTGYGPENIYFQEGSQIQNGEYIVKVHYYDDYYTTGPVDWSVSVQIEDEVSVYNGTLSEVDEVDTVTSFQR